MLNSSFNKQTLINDLVGFNNLHHTKLNNRKTYENLISCNHQFDTKKSQSSLSSSSTNNMSSPNKTIDLSGYLIFVTSNHNGCIKVYG